MKRLFIVRHAKSSWDYPYLTDFQRPLNQRGKRNVPDMAERFLNTTYSVNQIISSPAERAISTAYGFAAQLNISTAEIRQEEDLYHASVRTILDVISQTDDTIDNLMIFGHNPGFTGLINHVSDFSLYNLPTCAICGIEFNISSWKEIARSRGTKFYYDFPKSKSYH